MFKKVFSLLIIALMLFSCFGSISAGHITLHRTDKWTGGSWFNDWTDGGFHQTKYKNGWDNEYDTVGNTGEFEVVAQSNVWVFLSVLGFISRINIKNYDGRDIKITCGYYGKPTVEYNGERWQHDADSNYHDNRKYIFTINAQYNEGWVKIPCN